MADEILNTPQKVSLLLVDDRPDGLLALEAVLRSSQYDLIQASSGAEALQLLPNRDFAVILLDVQMPGMDGFQTARLIKQRPESRYIPIIFVTAINKDIQYIYQGYDAGAVDYLYKPFDPYILKAKVGVFTDLFRKNQQIRQQTTEILHLNENLREHAAQLETANKELEAFSYSVSHDLRTPLRAIDGFSRELLENAGPLLNERNKEDLQRIRAAAQRMAQLTEDLLNLSRVSRGDITKTAVNLSEHVEAIIGQLKHEYPQRRVEVTIAAPVIAKGDARLLHSVLENLVGNAWKFTQKRPQANIEFGVTDQAGKKVFFVRDNGAGFNMAYAKNLFGAFQRMHDANEFPGTGIGLASVQRIIHRHGGLVWAEAEENKGATIYFTL